MRTATAQAGALAVVLALGLPGPPGAEAQPGFYATPSLSVGEVYDDNLFSTPTGRQTDFISRFSPALEAAYRSAPLTLLGRYGFDAELYAEHPELNEAQVRQDASFEIQSRPTPTLRFGLTGFFRETQTAGELNVETGLAAGRERAQRLGVTTSAGWQLGPRTEATFDGEAADDAVTRGIDTRSYTAVAGLTRELTPRDVGRLGLTFRHFVFDGEETEMSEAVVVGWRRTLTPRTSVSLDAGPRFTDGSVDPEVSASLHHRLQTGDLSLTYARQQTTAIGQAGALTTDGLTALAAWEPRRFLRFRASPRVVRAERAGEEVMVYGLSLEASYQLTKAVALEARYDYAFQRGSTTPSAGADEIARNIVVLRVTFASPYRLR
jgi:hypothetical protein